MSHKKVSAMGVSHEETLLEETSSRELSLVSKITDLESELRSAKTALVQIADDKVSIRFLDSL